MELGRIEEECSEVRILTTGELKSQFIPWALGDRGQQSFIKLKKKEEVAYLFSGVGAVLQAEVQKALMRLVNEGWSVQGEVHITFEGSATPEHDILLQYDNISLELGPGLLPLVDPCQGAPLLERINRLREDIADELGFVVSSVRVKDNMRLQPQQYLIRFRESPYAVGEIFLDRFLALGSLEQLSAVPGWSVQEPAFRMNAKWIEVKDREKADDAGCIVQGALNVLLTHLSQAIRQNGGKVLGLQDVHHLLERIGNSHPVVVEEFLHDIKKLRYVRKVLQNLLAEQVSIKDMVTIMEIIGDNVEDLNNQWLMTEHVRRGIASQICWPLLGSEGIINAVTVEASLERKLINSLQDTVSGAYIYLDPEDDEQLLSAVRKALDVNEAPPVILTSPALRIYLWNLLSPQIHPLTILSTAEIPHDVRIQVIGEIKTVPAAKEESAEKKPLKRKKFWKAQE